jgi:hypothetical protein
MDPIQVRVLGTRELMAKLDRLQTFHRSPRLQALLNDAGQAYVLLAQRAAPKDTHALSRSLHHTVEGFGTPQVKVRVGFDFRASRYAYYVEHGSGPSVRYPRLKKFMHWFSAGPGGKTIQEPWGLKGQKGYMSHFARRVNHPGTKPQPFFLKHLEVIRDGFIKGLKQAVDEELQAGGRA